MRKQLAYSAKTERPFVCYMYEQSLCLDKKSLRFVQVQSATSIVPSESSVEIHVVKYL